MHFYSYKAQKKKEKKKKTQSLSFGYTKKLLLENTQNNKCTNIQDTFSYAVVFLS